MNLLNKLVSFLHYGFNRGPLPTPLLYASDADTALMVGNDGNRLTISNSGGELAALDIATPTVTLQNVADWLAGYFTDVALADITQADRPARMLLPTVLLSVDDDGNSTLTLTAHTSLLWCILDAYALELERAKTAIFAMLAQMRLDFAQAIWLDEWGVHYGLPRRTSKNEDDDGYRERVIATLFKLKCNNVAMELALSRDYGLYTTVSDHPTPGVFNVIMPFDVLTGQLPAEALANATEFINQFKAAGTRLDALQLDAALISDNLDTAKWRDVATLNIGAVNRYDGQHKFNGTIHYSPNYQQVILSD